VGIAEEAGAFPEDWLLRAEVEEILSAEEGLEAATEGPST
jgi:hypothetical protein